MTPAGPTITARVLAGLVTALAAAWVLATPASAQILILECAGAIHFATGEQGRVSPAATPFRETVRIDLGAQTLTHTWPNGAERTDSCTITEMSISCGTWPHRSIDRYSGAFHLEFQGPGAPFFMEEGASCRSIAAPQF